MLRIVRVYLIMMQFGLLLPMIFLLPFADPGPHVVIVVLIWTCFALLVILLTISYKKNIKVVYVMAYIWHFRMFVGLVA